MTNKQDRGKIIYKFAQELYPLSLIFGILMSIIFSIVFITMNIILIFDISDNSSGNVEHPIIGTIPISIILIFAIFISLRKAIISSSQVILFENGILIREFTMWHHIGKSPVIPGKSYNVVWNSTNFLRTIRALIPHFLHYKDIKRVCRKQVTGLYQEKWKGPYQFCLIFEMRNGRWHMLAGRKVENIFYILSNYLPGKIFEDVVFENIVIN